MRTHSIVAIAAVFLLTAGAARAAKVGDKAPEFTAQDSHGKTVKLADFKGKYVVMEWHNPECPYVKKHYDTGNMQKLQKEWTSKGVAWVTVLSSAPGKEGFLDAKAVNEELSKANAAPTAVLLDAKGDVGKQFGAKTTPHMFVINPEGRLVYNGAIDDKPSAEGKEVANANNYVAEALTESLAGKPVTHPSTPPYGCSVKY